MRVLLFSLISLSLSAAGIDAVSIPLTFEARDGQYVARAPEYSLAVSADSVKLDLGGSLISLRVAGGDLKSLPEGLDRQPGRAHYFFGSAHRSTEVYSRVRRRDIYPGIDLVLHGNRQHLEYDFDIAPRRDPSRIQLAFDGVDDILVDRNGDLVLHAGPREIRQPKPVAFQIVKGRRQLVDAAYRLDSSHRVSFRTARYDSSYPLVIDPELIFDTTFGGSKTNVGQGVALDSRGNIYIAGNTNSTDFPAAPSAFQNHAGTAPLLATRDGGQTWTSPSMGGAVSVNAIVAAPSAPSVLYAATDIGILKSADGGTSWTAPANVGLSTPPSVLAVDAGSSTTLYTGASFTGISYPGGQGFLVSTDAGATWTPSSNGMASYGAPFPSPIIVAIVAHPSKAGTVFAMTQNPTNLYRSVDFGATWSVLNINSTQNPFPSPAALVFSSADSNTMLLGQMSGPVLKSSDGGTTWTALSIQSVSNNQGLAIDPSNPSNVYLVNTAGVHRSSDGGQNFTLVLPKLSLYNDARLVVDPNTSTIYAVGRSGLFSSTDSGKTWGKIPLPYPVSAASLYVTPTGSRLLLGTFSQSDVFITKWSPDGKQLLYSTYLGGSGYDTATGIAVDSSGSAYVIGMTSSPDFPVSANAFQKTGTGTTAFVAKLSPDGSGLIYSSYLGGGTEQPGRIAVDPAGNATVTGMTLGGFPVTPNAFQKAPISGCSNPFGFVNVPTSGTAFITKVAADGASLVYSTLLGGACSTSGSAVALDANGSVWVTGQTNSSDFPVTMDAIQPKYGGGVADGFLARIDAQGQLAYATYLGGTNWDEVNAIAIDGTGNIFLTGSTDGFSQPASPGAFQPKANYGCITLGLGPPVFNAQGSAFVMKLDAAAHAVTGLTYFGTPCSLFGAAIAVDASGSPWISGSFGYLPIVPPPTVSPFQIGVGNGFMSKFSPDLTKLLFSTFFDTVNGLALDSAGTAYIAGAGLLNKAYVAKIDSAPQPVSLDGVSIAGVSAAGSSQTSAVAPGEVLRITGKNIGPAVNTPGLVDSSGVLMTSVAGVKVTFDGIPAPLLSVSAGEIDCLAPFALTGRTTTTMQIEVNGVKSNPVLIAVVASNVQVLGILNEDFTANSALNPAKAGSIVSLYIGGTGQTNPPSQDGTVNRVPLAQPGTPITVGYANDKYPVTFAGAAPGLAAGILQVNFVAPQESTNNVNVQAGGRIAYFFVAVR